MAGFRCPQCLLQRSPLPLHLLAGRLPRRLFGLALGFRLREFRFGRSQNVQDGDAFCFVFFAFLVPLRLQGSLYFLEPCGGGLSFREL